MKHEEPLYPSYILRVIKAYIRERNGRYVRAGQKTFQCFKCRRRRPVSKAVILWEARDVKEATYIVQWIKAHGVNKFLDLITR